MKEIGGEGIVGYKGVSGMVPRGSGDGEQVNPLTQEQLSSAAALALLRIHFVFLMIRAITDDSQSEYTKANQQLTTAS